ncbi:kinase-like protein [Glonium stellatum]|uniref:Kinase-like protein n=1 Tax=Glonium stellatum TaxID=574774 RepID=A0A8E2EP74_9PEZI|nr:kinase-like protein [Glonium stellatum]
MDREDIEELLAHWIPKAPLPPFIDDTVFLEITTLLKQHPDAFIQRWAANPRIYTLLRMLGYDEHSTVFAAFDREKVGDVLLPLAASYISSLEASGLSRSDFRKMQPHVLSEPRSMNEANFLSDAHSHRHIINGEAHFEELEQLGKGGSAHVWRVRHKLSGKYFACKRIVRGRNLKEQKKQLVEFEQELSVIQRVRHKHLVAYVGSYSDFESFSLILSPVADQVLTTLLSDHDRHHQLSSQEIHCLRNALGCLATALSYLHDQRVRHKDIKPGNILLSAGRIYLCDFGISRDWSNDDHSTTEGEVYRYTRRYCAPEVIGQGSRNKSSDIWSLGCVFLEIVTVIKGFSLDELNDFLLVKSEGFSAHGLWSAPKAIKFWLDHIRDQSADDHPLDWIAVMISEDTNSRPAAEEIVKMIEKHYHESSVPVTFIGNCCARLDSINSSGPGDSPTLHLEPKTGLRISNASAKKSSSDMVDRTQLFPNRSASSKGSQELSRGDSGIGTIPYTPSYLDPESSPEHLSNISPKSSRTSQSQPIPQPRQSFTSFEPAPVPPPAPFELYCLCGPQAKERHIFNAEIISFSTNMNIPTAHTHEQCMNPKLRVQIYETMPEDPTEKAIQSSIEGMSLPKIWWITRRLAVSYQVDNPARRHCSSFWLPLTDLQFETKPGEVTLHWSDCNQIKQKSSGKRAP